MLQHGPSGVEDYQIFHSNVIVSSPYQQPFSDTTDTRLLPQMIEVEGFGQVSLDSFVDGTNTLAFLVLRDDTIFYERYANGHTEQTLSLGFSMTKSVVSLLIGCAIDDGLIKSVEDPVTDYLPELQENGFSKVKLRHLLQMTSGLDYAENDNPFGLHARLYYCEHCLEQAVASLTLAEQPGSRFQYKSGDYLLLAAVLRKVMQGESLATYLQSRIWQPLGMESGALWSTDGDVEKSWCCLAATARSFARLGVLYANRGLWNGKQIVSRDWVERSSGSIETDGAAWNYQFGWWHPFRDTSDYMMIGHLEQYVFVNPDTRVVIVRVGLDDGGVERKAWQDLLAMLSRSVAVPSE